MINEEMCRLILQYVDSINIFPELEVYNRLYRNRQIHHTYARNATQTMLCENNILKVINSITEYNAPQVEETKEEYNYENDLQNDDDADSEINRENNNTQQQLALCQEIITKYLPRKITAKV